METDPAAQDLAAQLKKKLLDRFCDTWLMPEESEADRLRKVRGMAQLVGISDELIYHLTDFRRGIECRLRLMERKMVGRPTRGP